MKCLEEKEEVKGLSREGEKERLRLCFLNQGCEEFQSRRERESQSNEFDDC